MENNINEEQPIPLSNQEEPIQDPTPVEVKSKPKIKKVLIILLAFLLLIFVGVVAYLLIKPKSAKPVDNNNTATENNTEITEEEPFLDDSPFAQLVGDNPSNNSGCDNYTCLISAAQNCEQIVATISYTDVPNPIVEALDMPDIFLTSGQSVYEIKKKDEENLCSIYISHPSLTLTFTEDYKKELSAQGLTEQDINSQLEMMNDSLNSEEVTQSKEICTAGGNVIAEFLRDMEKGNLNIEANTGTRETVYTTSSGNILKCVTYLPSSGN